ncbi:conserved hypothetical protein [Talaromyces stipitatus ATCC 10500]|uniref:Transcription factor domain-containing protein n=1 Tax=Talaromyces stipitatus (strain ATCC 10500 / CBS 375.48 / QM 6759 / NRRL 1006) TaxID=441959 RepID=B8MPI1_TALSN|nr:uncharacterized protein TSTA_106290 [Talaromyces stipitatus ATCC 10500]EED14420.1 conserved hypothetical protein [Talaromyces stipitatus ATCC 10500]
MSIALQNTATPVVFDGYTTARQWINSSTGGHIRWGVLAIIANYVGSYAMISKSADPFFQQFNMDRESLLNQVLDVSDVCKGFCCEYEALDDTFLCALFEQYNITIYTKGEACYATYRIGAELNSALITMGLHQEIKADAQVPFFLAELRKRLRALIYKSEISITTFLGRPPRLSHRYMNLEPPLDLTDAQNLLWQLLVDENGYNRDGEIRHVSWVGSSISFTARREDILELSLGNYTQEEVRQKAIDIQPETEEHWATLPHYMSSIKESIFGLESEEVSDLHFRNVFRQGPQVNSLLLHRVLMRKAGADPAELIRTAQTILGDVMRTYKRVEMSAAASFIYFLAVHGMRSAVILAIEPLKQEQLPEYPNEPLLPRSRTIQDLSIFAAKLGELDTVFGDKNLCKKGQKVITRILDKILSPNTSSPQSHAFPIQTQQLDTMARTTDMLQNAHILENPTFLNDFSYDISAQMSGPDYEFRQWLESMGEQNWDL